MTNALPLDGSHLDIVTMIESDHRAIHALMARFSQEPPEGRSSVFGQLRHLLVSHEMAEEQVLYPALRTVTDQVEPMLQARLAEQAAAQELLAELDSLDAAAPGFAVRFDELQQAVTAHAAAEEQDVLPLVAELEQALDRPSMGARYEEAKRRAPTHPHPHAPNHPPANLIAGPVAGLVDRVRDALKRDD